MEIILQKSIYIQNTQMSIKIVLSLFFLIAAAFSLCVDPLQREGECTKCDNLDVLIDGRCFIKIRRCNKHQRAKNTPDKVNCLECQYGFGLRNNTCVSVSVLAGGKDVALNPNDFAIVALTENQIKDQLGDSYGSYFTYAHDLFLSKYASQLGKGQVKTVRQVQAKKGVLLVIDYLSDSKLPYQAVAFVQKSGFAREWSFGLLLVNGKQPFGLHSSIIKILGDYVKDSFLYDYRLQDGNYVLEFMNPALDVLRISVSQIDVQNQPNISSKLVVKKLTLPYLAIEALGKIYAGYNPESITSVKKFDDFYIVNLGPSNSVSFTFLDNKFITNVPLYRPNHQQTNAAQTNGKPLLGGYTDFTNYADSGFVNCIQFAARQFPQLLGASLVKVKVQQVQGTNYNISLKKQGATPQQQDLYEVEVYISLQSNIQLNSLTKNGGILYHSQYNYNEDPTFFKAYKQVLKSNISSAYQGISSVLYKKSENRKYYKISYNPKQYAEIEHNSDNSVTKLLSFTLHGENILETLAPFRDIAKNRNPQILMNFIREKEPMFNYSRVQQIIQNQSLYSLNVVTSEGNYIVIVQDKGGLLSLNKVTKISTVSCYTLNPQEAQNSDKINIIDQFLRSNYPLDGFKPQLIQISVRVASTNYRILYANPKLKQVQIQLEEVDNVANVIKASYMNYGFQIADTVASNPDYQAILTVIKNSGLGGQKIPFLTQVNSTFINSYYDDGKLTTQITIEKLTKKTKIQIIGTRSYLLAPDGFNFSKLLIPGTPSQSDAINLDKIVQEAVKAYPSILELSTVAFAEKTGNTYTLMFRNDLGYQRVQAKFDQNGILTIGRLAITGYHDSDFTNCKKLAANGRCLSCNQETEVQYEGACFPKMKGCLIQPGNICVKCNANFIKSAQKCYEECTNFFQ